MAKKKTEKAQEPKEIKTNRTSNFTKSETTQFVHFHPEIHAYIALRDIVW